MAASECFKIAAILADAFVFFSGKPAGWKAFSPSRMRVRTGIRPPVQRLLVCRFLQDAGADGVCHLKQVLLPDKAKLCLVAVRKADRQLGRLQRVAKARRLDAIV